ncbi:UNKNOWN [Stylonychia lemnae]|uniref:Smr domain-containing protein n=1 Tax=Stylonychia lemnae TaxID=5949 RepID=A0A078ALK7_STYLE|nr:UNKNOWN [Stylonychia lemnae]|eukprot:CDW82756.1 UNKNOWN [Stylonychia lemnae]
MLDQSVKDILAENQKAIESNQNQISEDNFHYNDYHLIQENQRLIEENKFNQNNQGQVNNFNQPQNILKKKISFELTPPQHDVLQVFYKHYQGNARSIEGLKKFMIIYFRLGEEQLKGDWPNDVIVYFRERAPFYHSDLTTFAIVYLVFGKKVKNTCSLSSIGQALLCEASGHFDVQIKQKMAKFRVPNCHIFNDVSQDLWTRELVNMFCFENWQDYDDNQLDSVKDDRLNQNKVKDGLIDILQKTKQLPDESLVDYLDRVQQEYNDRQIEVNLPERLYRACNSDPEIQNYQIDLHYQFYLDAKYLFQKYYRKILLKLEKNELLSNASQGFFIVKVICGYGHGRSKNSKDGLKEKFYEYLKDNLYDFAYLTEHGSFLIRAQY